MKSISKSKHILMMCLFSACMLVASFNGFSQKRGVIQDPSLGKMEFYDAAGNQVNEEYIQPQQIMKLSIPVAVINHGKQVPAGSCKIKIGLGSKLTLDPSYDINTTVLGNYFKWTISDNGGQKLITGELVNALPENYESVNVGFKVIPVMEGSSTITANFLITNHNTNTILSDEDGTNNISFTHYRITTLTAPVPVTTISELAKAACSIHVSFGTDKEINLSRYEVEVSRDAVNYVKVGTVAATNLSLYSLDFNITQDIQAKVVYVRIKSIDKSGRILYSNAKTVDGTCNENWKLDIFPNPAANVRSVVVRAVEGMFNGKYIVSMSDMAGKNVCIKQLQLNGANSFNYEFGNVAAGKYFIKVMNADGSQATVLNFEKL